MIDAALIAACAPAVAAETIQAIVRVESAGDVLALASNRKDGAVRLRPRDYAHAVELATQEIRDGNSVDIGLMQINSRNLGRLELTVAEVLDPCTNIKAGATILTASYVSAVRLHGEGQGALQAALSAYNTGNFEGGFRNGYVNRYFASQPDTPPSTNRMRAAPAESYTAASTVYRRTNQELDTMTLAFATTVTPLVVEDYAELLTPGVQVQLSPEEAEAIGLTAEPALSEGDAWASQSDPSHFDVDDLAAKAVNPGSHVIFVPPRILGGNVTSIHRDLEK